MNNWRKLKNLSNRERMVLLEAVFFLGAARALIKILPFRRVRKLITGREQAEGGPSSAESLERVERVGRMIRAASRRLPWQCLCLTQALAGKLMLARRGIESTVYIGVKKDPSKEVLESHAWLKWQDRCITGARGHENFTIMTDFKAQQP